MWLSSSRGICDVPDPGSVRRTYRLSCGEIQLLLRRDGEQVTGSVGLWVTETREFQRCETLNTRQVCSWDSMTHRARRTAPVQFQPSTVPDTH